MSRRMPDLRAVLEKLVEAAEDAISAVGMNGWAYDKMIEERPTFYKDIESAITEAKAALEATRERS